MSSEEKKTKSSSSLFRIIIAVIVIIIAFSILSGFLQKIKKERQIFHTTMLTETRILQSKNKEQNNKIHKELGI